MVEENSTASGARVKSPHAVVAFDTTSDAMAMDAAARTHGLPGRIIPVPSEISAGCGMAWSVPLAQRDELEEGIRAHDLAHEGIYVVDLF